MARPSKLDSAMQDKICAALREGKHLEEAATDAGISTKTLRRWMDRGERTRLGPHRRFYLAVSATLKETRARLLAVVQRAARWDWRAARYLLDTTYADPSQRAALRSRRRRGRDEGSTTTLTRSCDGLRSESTTDGAAQQAHARGDRCCAPMAQQRRDVRGSGNHDGISVRTLHRWVRRGMREHETLHRFLRDAVYAATRDRKLMIVRVPGGTALRRQRIERPTIAQMRREVAAMARGLVADEGPSSNRSDES